MKKEKSDWMAVYIFSELVGAFLCILGYWWYIDVFAGNFLDKQLRAPCAYLITGCLLVTWPALKWAFGSYRRAALTIALLLTCMAVDFARTDNYEAMTVYLIIAVTSFIYSFLNVE